MKRHCVQCGKEYVIAEREIEILKENGADLPVRCPACRRSNRKRTKIEYPRRKVLGLFSLKKSKGEPRRGTFSMMFSGRFFFAPVLILILFSIMIGNRMEKNYHKPTSVVSGSAGGWSSGLYDKKETQMPDDTFKPDEGVYIFESFEMLTRNYEEYGKKMGYASEEAYLSAANAIISDEKSICTQDESGNIFYENKENYFTVTVKNGYIVSFFEKN